MVTGVVPSSPRFLPSIFIAHRVQQSHCSSMFHRGLLLLLLTTRALALSASSQFVRKKKSPGIYTSTYALGGARPHTNWPIPGSRITWYATRATGYKYLYLYHKWNRSNIYYEYHRYKLKYTPAVRSNILSKLIGLYILQDSLDKRMHFLPQLSDFVPLRNRCFIVSARRLTNITLLSLIPTL